LRSGRCELFEVVVDEDSLSIIMGPGEVGLVRSPRVGWSEGIICWRKGIALAMSMGMALSRALFHQYLGGGIGELHSVGACCGSAGSGSGWCCSGPMRRSLYWAKEVAPVCSAGEGDQLGAMGTGANDLVYGRPCGGGWTVQ